MELCNFCGQKVQIFHKIKEKNVKIADKNMIVESLIGIFNKDIVEAIQTGADSLICTSCLQQLIESFKFVQKIQTRNLKLCFVDKQQVGEVAATIKEGNCCQFSTKPGLRKLLPKTDKIEQRNIEKPTSKDKPSRLYKCLECCDAFKSFKLLCKHEQKHKAIYNLNNIHICQFCHLCFVQENALSDHLNEQHPDNRYLCCLCTNSNAFNGKGFLMQHINKQHNHEFLQYYCAECSEIKIFANLKELEEHFWQKKHFLNEMNTEVTAVNNDAEQSQNTDDDMDLEMHEEFLDEFLLAHTNENSFQFSECWDALDLHLPDMLQSATTSTAALAIAKQTIATEAFQCPHCLNQFQQPQKLLQHLAEIHDIPVLVCKKCEKSFKSAKVYKEHRMQKSCKEASTDKSTAIPCPYCDKSFKSSVQLKQHLSTIHTQLKRHICQLCDKQFSTLDHLKKHVLSQHQNERKYICEEHGCGKAFTQLCHLKEHAITHKSNKSVQCSKCDEKFWRKIDLKRHRREHHMKKLDK